VKNIECTSTISPWERAEWAGALPRTHAFRNAALKGVVAAFDRLAEWQRRAAQRRALVALSDYELKDIGISRADAASEAAKPFWRR
jgi:uncharacterized protein YjiS (DUF1127 family)